MTYLEGLNDRQKEAVLATHGPVSVLAGAGSGKTKVLTTRIYHLIREGVLPENILAVTFTNKAAREMKERLSHRLEGASLPFVATFHGLGREILEKYGRPLDVPRYFTIFDRDDSERAIKEALKALDVDPKEVPPRSILSRISKAKSEGYTLSSFREKHSRESFKSRIAAEAWARYESTLKKEKALDFDDLICLPVRLLEEHADVRKEVQERFHFIHIDEFQDTNELQGRLAALLCGERKNLFVVGDIDQTIYTWRGATIDNLLSFDHAYPNAKTIILEHNYRSTKTIVEAANQIIEKNRNRKEKVSVTGNDYGDRIMLHMADTSEREALWIAKETKRRIRAGVAPEEVAVLFRTNFQSRAIEEAFLHEQVPYRLLGTRFFDRKEVKDVLSWVRLALDPAREADRMRAVQFPSRGIGKVTLGKLTAGKRSELRAGEKTKVEAFEEIVYGLNAFLPGATPSVFVRTVIQRSGIEDTLAKGSEEDKERLENAKELATLAARYDYLTGEEGIAAFLADAALAGDQDEMDRPGKSGVTLMTVHAAKGLEFDIVFVAGLEEGLFPHEGMGGDEDRDEEEERRLFYVAVTRARKCLILSMARVRRIYGTDYLQEPSQFLHDIDASLMEHTNAYGDDDGFIIEA
ncbi:MAG TPA: UvrD-helicase domain-containing protein [Candidatus Paceibacterota bacterium]|nr:UvrD-helicase domain-containing protein [Candidatus Paceibacterota bacterium]